ncbi:hypothetical protein [Streptomyces sp. NBC_01445]|uniref:hypothetical protein n=1 Tax=Streptomyces sp. NBC_01445 TaxID=2903869 RepID=UPI002DD9BB38|nr:hypothetical protein [Streptomyces sp. NBC_01445]WSE08900.1 hypothetical protein OG574_39350 [Streptomyces sp. NBC_01445]
MALLFIGIDPNTGGGNCPAVWVDQPDGAGEEPELVLQGWLADAAMLERCAQDSPRPDTEAVIRIPARMVKQIREACDVVERSQF